MKQEHDGEQMDVKSRYAKLNGKHVNNSISIGEQANRHHWLYVAKTTNDCQCQFAAMALHGPSRLKL